MTITPFIEVNQAIVASGGESLNLCMQCGLCAGLCPWSTVESPFSPRMLIKMGQLGMEGFESDDILYACTTCNKCVINCPRGVKLIDIFKAMRAMIAETGAIPPILRSMLGSIHSNGNPWSDTREKRPNWYKDEPVNTFTPDTEYFLFVCCTSAYDVRSQKIAKAMVKILNAAGVSFGVIGEEESCCGESARKVGAEEEFSNLAQRNVELFTGKGVKKIITTSPHCYHTFKNEYPEFGGDFEVIHYTELLADLLDQGKLKLPNQVAGKVAYHDPCYLGRHSKLLQAIPGLELVSLPREKKNSHCCGGGGGRLWMETLPEQRFSDYRVVEAVNTGADTLATSCPYCVTMLEDSRRSTNKEDIIAVKDLAELIAEAL
ncbi:MAG: (Fe-S)-binding protein [Deltaproteobacteria bacterium]|nr:(Fe-S)-binding protein [Deltaproteobacteria bacterium]